MEINGIEDMKAFQESVLDLLAAGGTLGDLCEYTEQDYEAIYMLGHSFYGQGRYTDALKAFGFLMISNHFDSRFAFSFAACCQMLKRYEEAVRCYTIASVMDPENPVPTFHIAECLVSLGMVNEAAEMFEVAIDEAGPQHGELKTRAAALRAMLLNKK